MTSPTLWCDTATCPATVYDQCIGMFGEADAIVMLNLVGQYQLVSSLLVCFRVPAPSDARGKQVPDAG